MSKPGTEPAARKSKVRAYEAFYLGEFRLHVAECEQALAAARARLAEAERRQAAGLPVIEVTIP